ncbi:hypothetical protein, partial [Klebsiella pneumoniae]|uniref:hypothetical protein n=8 Tax=Klebsiella pneumoniae TaxID=573 RepID=UPI001D0DCC5B
MPDYRPEKLSAMRPTGRIFVSSSHQIMPGNERQIALQSTFLATKTAFYIAMRPVYPRKIEKFYDFINGHKLLMNPLMILVKIIKLRWIHILSYDQM